MEHQGERLKQLTKAKGFNMSQLAGMFGVTRTAVENHFKREQLTRKVVSRYAEKLGFSLDDFFEEINLKSVQQDKKIERQINLNGETVPAEIHLELQRKYFDLQERYDNLVLRFFPNAVQQDSITA
ncbi:hypothetical protein GO755_32820 [Spirosoma sp. HMF4905]|uniref:HTH cro/C1-type domain-containing protein n=1 Tax=Spirosoma arboris TaxID=2682092 RepID=A0A7K1SM61_9BACT|nr:helix-turn-helix transcriptional regulator [Spirosoma arboris]MVM34858.1 hypothetical protein [Spirosoma arboris]